MIHLAYTSVRLGVTEQQVASVTNIVETLVQVHPGEVTAHHGCGMGGDRIFHDLVRRLGLPIVGYPTILQPEDELHHYQMLHPPMRPHPRSRLMVSVCDALIVAPFEDHEMTRINTWILKRTAQKKSKATVIVLPNGATTYGGKDWPA